ncbi:MAG: 1-deoxy-D-xylulose-5-phosphate reductoisomerase [Acidimicrobiia bacterium]|nr:1-deoxy-D-xylulose-5-phosphate reductoisomerase [Acidimicrobiia bacterium]
MTRTVAVLGSTGSVGTQALDVIGARPDRYRVVALAARSSAAVLVEQAHAVRPEVVAVVDPAAAAEVAGRLPPGTTLEVGEGALAAAATGADVVLNAVVGFAGLDVTLAALAAGRRLALANKESLIAAGPVVRRALATPGAEIVPVDSEHSAIHQCLRAGQTGREVRRLLLTASGGPFRGHAPEQLASVGVSEALAHPTWSMGPKITVDSSTLVNKGLEVIEAHELFDVPYEDIDVVVHPQSIVHSMVEFLDGSTVAQLSRPDMRLPISYALGYPERHDVPYGALDWSAVGRLDFEPPDHAAFPCLGLAYQAGRLGGTAPAWFNAANEVAVAAFLEEKIPWLGIAAVLETVLSRHDGGKARTAGDVVDADRTARRLAHEEVERLAPLRATRRTT